MLDNQGTPQPVYLKDYQRPPFSIPHVELTFDLAAESTRVTSTFKVVRCAEGANSLVLDGKDLHLVSVALDGRVLSDQDYQITDEHLIIPTKAASFTVEITTQINPAANTQLMGLYMSGGNFCTQCEAEGFRRITYFLDRPDVMSRYRTTLRADKKQFPVLLSNGNPQAKGELPEDRHFATWDDPHPKPTYLFALVAGNLKAYSDHFITRSGKRVDLNIWVAENDLDRCDHAMSALKKAMTWDEVRYGREYDLDVFNIVAVSDFNFGAMENKGLNIFNSKYVLARPETATDGDFDAVESVIAHEYFHNWTGNRITCRDWFQLSLKEGLTVYRDQEFSADHGSRALKRIEDVRSLRASQFPEDAGPLAHPVRPDSYIEISNFYTSTVYNKGAEVIRMMATLLGPEKFAHGMDIYFSRHDGQAATCDNFVAAMEDASALDLSQFKLWYSQAGTPHLDIRLDYTEAEKMAELIVRQFVPQTPGQAVKAPLHIPLRASLFGSQSAKNLTGDQLLEVRKTEERFIFHNITERPVASVLRGFSAPVIVSMTTDQSDLAFLSAHDDDPFARYEAMQKLALDLMLEQVAAHKDGRAVTVAPVLLDAVSSALAARDLDPALVAEAVSLPSEAYIGDHMAIVDVEGIHTVRQTFRKTLSSILYQTWLKTWKENQDARYAFTAQAKGRRRLKNTALHYLMALEEKEAVVLSYEQFTRADNMTDRVAALSVLASANAPEREQAFKHFYDMWHHDPLVMDKWFTVQALSLRSDTLDQVKALTRHPDFSRANPNRLRALVGAFAANQPHFNARSGEGYCYLADQIIAVDTINPQSAARLVGYLGRWRRFDSSRAHLMRKQLERIADIKGLSKDVYEMVTKSLK